MMILVVIMLDTRTATHYRPRPQRLEFPREPVPDWSSSSSLDCRDHAGDVVLYVVMCPLHVTEHVMSCYVTSCDMTRRDVT